ncbi:ester cyclase [Natrarchaeobaculum aegyptiacum]|uniref:SnoaL-like domain-containing protein n=1 Tax=Natrarchaeobaculum aegyptiacum TaxID=745377 RepID=A0A2Z2HZ42_9EURY|nr:nuclear transport factor 2 family protein [Natrarchaeobaculum aegyptiacum]ARS88898.1 hypothetical protein B1756_03445 [Natrarchaeobaculum aegyptiacum]
MSKSESENVDILRESIAYHNDPESRDRYLECYDETVRIHGADVDGLEELREFYRFVWDTIPDLTVTIEHAIADDDEVAVRYTWRGTHAETGDPVELDSGLTWYRFEDGKIVERWIARGTATAIADIVDP